MAMYMVSQLAGGIAAALCATAAFGEFSNFGPAGKYSWVEAGIAETLYPFMLCFVVLRAAACGVSGGAFNPAVAFGLDVASAHLGFKYCLVYTLFEFVGAGLAVAVHMAVDSRKGTEPTLMKKAVSEFVGTYFLVLTVYLNVTGMSPAGGLSIAASLMCMIYALGGVSGANFNPAVTLALLITNKGGMSASLAPVYMAAQLLGGFVAGATALFCCGGSKEIASLVPGSSNLTKALIGETAFTFVLCFVVLNVACTTAKAPIM